MDKIKIDGSMGEGGGQVLRTALTLALIKQVQVEIINIRAKRRKPGLLCQHLTCVRAAREICSGIVEGDELGSQHVILIPGKIKAGDYQFAIGTAGSTSLVCQTILLPLALTGRRSTITFEGGTHNGMSPSTTFMEEAFLPILAKMGIDVEVNVEAFGFYPAGGGKWTLDIRSCDCIQPLDFLEAKEAKNFCPEELEKRLSVIAMISQLPVSIAQREIDTVARRLKLPNDIGQIREIATPGPGNCLMINYQQRDFNSVFEVVGEVGVSAEKVAKRAVGCFVKLLNAGVIVDEYLADQLMLPMVVANGGSFTTTQPSLHTLTNADVIKQFGIEGLKIEQVTHEQWCISVTK